MDRTVIYTGPRGPPRRHRSGLRVCPGWTPAAAIGELNRREGHAPIRPESGEPRVGDAEVGGAAPARPESGEPRWRCWDWGLRLTVDEGEAGVRSRGPAAAVV